MCAEPVGPETFWDQKLHGRVLHRAAKLVADLTLAYKIPVRYIDEGGRFNRGIIVDTPSGWPSAEFLSEVKAQQALKKHI